MLSMDVGSVDRILREHREEKAKLKTALALIDEMSLAYLREVIAHAAARADEMSRREGRRERRRDEDEDNDDTDVAEVSEPVRATRALPPRRKKTTHRDLIFSVVGEATAPLGSSDIFARVREIDPLREKASIVSEVHRMCTDGVLFVSGSSGRGSLYSLSRPPSSDESDATSVVTRVAARTRKRQAAKPWLLVLRDGDLDEYERPEDLTVEDEATDVRINEEQLAKYERELAAEARAPAEPLPGYVLYAKEKLARHQRRLQAARLLSQARARITSAPGGTNTNNTP